MGGFSLDWGTHWKSKTFSSSGSHIFISRSGALNHTEHASNFLRRLWGAAYPGCGGLHESVILCVQPVLGKGSSNVLLPSRSLENPEHTFWAVPARAQWMRDLEFCSQSACWDWEILQIVFFTLNLKINGSLLLLRLVWLWTYYLSFIQK